MKIRSSQSQVEINEQRRRVTFYAAIFNQPSVITEEDSHRKRFSYTEIIAPTAFDHHIKNGGEVLATINHDFTRSFAKRSLGELLIASDPYGLFATAWLVKNDQGDEIMHRVRSGEIDATSFGFLPVVDEQGPEGEVIRKVVQLGDVSLLSVPPAYNVTKGEVMLRAKQEDQRHQFLLNRYRYALVKNRNVKGI